MIFFISLLLNLAQVQPGAAVTHISVTEKNGCHWFGVTVKSPDMGCNQYADWWEVIDEQGKLIYRRILAHSHVKEQPFTRYGGPKKIDVNKVIIIRAHMNNLGYGTRAMKGTIKDGFKACELEEDFAQSLAREEPLPLDCKF